MKIKHYAGYGTVNATKIKSDENELVIKVEGNHEQGIYRDDIYDIFNWLVKKFDKKTKNMTFREWNAIYYPTLKIEFADHDGIECCIYKIDYEN